MKTYACPYCDAGKMVRDKLILHIHDNHMEQLPEGWSPEREVFKIVYGKTHGTCVIDKKPTEWNEKTNKYKRFCSERCKKEYAKQVKNNIMKVYHTTMKEKLNDPEFQDRMLKGRRISGQYTFRNGTKKDYVGSYEKKLLEFWDKVMEINPDDLLCPGPTLEYTDSEGNKRKWITDELYTPYNLIIEVKDGGDNPNKAIVNRSKQLCKEKMITNLGTYNYLRLTNNDFGQLLSILTELKLSMIDDTEDNLKTNIIRIHESVNPKKEITRVFNELMGCPSPVVGASFDDNIKNVPETPSTAKLTKQIFIGRYSSLDNPEVEGTYIMPDIYSPKVIIKPKGSKNIFAKKKTEAFENAKFDIYSFSLDSSEKYNRFYKLLSIAENGEDMATNLDLFSFFLRRPIYFSEQVDFEPEFHKVNLEETEFGIIEDMKTTISEAKKILSGKPTYYFPVINGDFISNLENNDIKIDESSNLLIREDYDGFFIYNKSTKTRTRSYERSSLGTRDLVERYHDIINGGR